MSIQDNWGPDKDEDENDGPVVDHSVPYPEAPEVDHGDLRQEHYRGARDPEQAPKRQGRFHDRD